MASNGRSRADGWLGCAVGLGGQPPRPRQPHRNAAILDHIRFVDRRAGVQPKRVRVAADKTKIAGKFLGTITGDGTTTSFAFTHNLNITNPFLSVRDSSGNQILADNQATSANALSVTFSVAPPVSTNYTVTIIG